MGQRFAGRYELVDHLGEGGSGTVWRAWDHRLGGYVAAKLLRQRDAGSLLRFVREQSLRVQHPHVLAPVGWAAEDDDVLLTMELVRGGSLEVLLADYGPLPVGFVLVLLDQLLDGLTAVHAAGIVHRDVKPANLLLAATGSDHVRLLLGDFGIAVLAGEPRLTETGLVIGTPGYVAPEVARGGAGTDARQDLYAVGVVGWRLLTGRPTSELDDPAALAGVPSEVVAWLASLLAADPAARIGSAASARATLPALTDVSAPVGPPWRDAGGGEIEVFDHLADLPYGWAPAGPAGPAPPSAPPPEARVRVPMPVVGAAVTLVDPTSPTPDTRAGEGPAMGNGEGATDDAGTASGEPAAVGEPTAPAAGRPFVRAAAAGVLLLVGVAAVVAAAVTSSGDVTPSTGGPSPGAGPTTSRTPGGLAAPTTAATPGAPVAADGERVVAGSACAFAQVGQRSPTATGTAICTLAGSTYTWVAVP